MQNIETGERAGADLGFVGYQRMGRDEMRRITCNGTVWY